MGKNPLITALPQTHLLPLEAFPVLTNPRPRCRGLRWVSMATERQIAANRLNAAKSTGPKTSEGKRRSSQNASLRLLDSSADDLKGESLRRYNALAADFILQFQPRSSAETALIQTMILARWRVLSIWGAQTSNLQAEITRARQDRPSAGSAFASAFRSLVANSRSFHRLHRLEAHYQRQFHQSLAKFLKLRETELATRPTRGSCPSQVQSSADFSSEANSVAVSAPFLRRI
jgi:hypothetical protein